MGSEADLQSICCSLNSSISASNRIRVVLWEIPLWNFGKQVLLRQMKHWEHHWSTFCSNRWRTFWDLEGWATKSSRVCWKRLRLESWKTGYAIHDQSHSSLQSSLEDSWNGTSQRNQTRSCWELKRFPQAQIFEQPSTSNHVLADNFSPFKLDSNLEKVRGKGKRIVSSSKESWTSSCCSLRI